MMNNMQKNFKRKAQSCRVGLQAGAVVQLTPEQQRREMLRRQIERDAELERQEAAKRMAVPQPAARPVAPAAAPVQQTPQPAVQPASPAAPAVDPLRLKRTLDERMRGLRSGAVIPGHDTQGKDDIPVNVSGGEAVLPVKTVDAMGGPDAVASLIASTNGKAPNRGLRAGGEYELGFTRPTSVANDALEVARHRGAARLADAGRSAMGEAAQAARGVNAGTPLPPNAAVAAENARNAQAAIDATQKLGAQVPSAAPSATAGKPSGLARAGVGTLALAPVIGAAGAAMTPRADVDKLGGSIGVDTGTKGGRVTANVVNALDKTGNAATLGLAGRFGQALADQAGTNAVPSVGQAMWDTAKGLRQDMSSWWNAPSSGGVVGTAAAAQPAAAQPAAAQPAAAQPAAAQPAATSPEAIGTTELPRSATPTMRDAIVSGRMNTGNLPSGEGVITSSSGRSFHLRSQPSNTPIVTESYTRAAPAAGASESSPSGFSKENLPGKSDTWDDMWRKSAARRQETEGLRAATARYGADSSAATSRHNAGLTAQTAAATRADAAAQRDIENRRNQRNDTLKESQAEIEARYPVTAKEGTPEREAQQAKRDSFMDSYYTTLGNTGIDPASLSQKDRNSLVKLHDRKLTIDEETKGLWQDLRRIVGVSDPRVTDADLRTYVVTGVDKTGLINNRLKGRFGDVEAGKVVGGPGWLGTGTTRGGQTADVEEELNRKGLSLGKGAIR